MVLRNIILTSIVVIHLQLESLLYITALCFEYVFPRMVMGKKHQRLSQQRTPCSSFYLTYGHNISIFARAFIAHIESYVPMCAEVFNWEAYTDLTFLCLTNNRLKAVLLQRNSIAHAAFAIQRRAPPQQSFPCGRD